MSTLLILLVLVLAAVVIGQIVRIFELSTAIKGIDENEITEKDNDWQGLLMLLFMIGMLGSFIWMIFAYQDVVLPKSASAHGNDVDRLWDISMATILVMFFITQPILFYFSYKYRGKASRKADFVSHNDKLELVWTVIPAIVLAGLILYGLSTAHQIMFDDPEEEPLVVEIYAKQFGWNARYAGTDNLLGYANVRNIEGVNILGVDVASQRHGRHRSGHRDAPSGESPSCVPFPGTGCDPLGLSAAFPGADELRSRCYYAVQIPRRRSPPPRCAQTSSSSKKLPG